MIDHNIVDFVYRTNPKNTSPFTKLEDGADTCNFVRLLNMLAEKTKYDIVRLEDAILLSPELLWYDGKNPVHIGSGVYVYPCLAVRDSDLEPVSLSDGDVFDVNVCATRDESGEDENVWIEVCAIDQRTGEYDRMYIIQNGSWWPV